MIEAVIYLGIFVGVYEATGRFWFSLGWPYQAGRLLGASALLDPQGSVRLPTRLHASERRPEPRKNTVMRDRFYYGVAVGFGFALFMGFLLSDGAERQCQKEHAVDKCEIVFQPAAIKPKGGDHD